MIEICSHELKLNKEEDFVFCIKCGKSWKNKIEYVLTPITPNTTPIIPNNPYYTPTIN